MRTRLKANLESRILESRIPSLRRLFEGIEITSLVADKTGGLRKLG